MTKSVILTPLPGLPHIKPGDDLAALLLASLDSGQMALQDGDVLAVAQKIVSKVEGRHVNLGSVTPTPRARRVAAEVQKDPRLVELILRESTEISRQAPNTLIVRHRLGFTSANAGIDRSNVPQGEEGELTVLLLPEDPDASADGLRRAILARAGVEVGVVVVDSHGRPFRLGTVGVAIGVSGLPALWDRRGDSDLYGYHLQHTDVGIADEIAAAASMIMGQGAEGTPVVLMRGLALPAPSGVARDLVRPREKDLYR